MPNHRKDYDLAVDLYVAGLSIGDVAEFYAVSRQAMWDILSRRGVVFRPQKQVGRDNVFYRGGVTQNMRVAKLMRLAIEKGVLTPPSACSRCGVAGRVEGHHADYNLPLSVTWLCHKCHYEWHLVNVVIPATREYRTMKRGEIASLGGRKRKVGMDELLQ
jgi:ribosomal protein S27AE